MYKEMKLSGGEKVNIIPYYTIYNYNAYYIMHTLFYILFQLSEMNKFWMKNISLFDEPYEDTREFWVKYLKHYCGMPLKKRVTIIDFFLEMKSYVHNYFE